MAIDQINHLELVVERFVIEEDPGILIFAIPLIFQLTHALYETFQFGITDQADQRGSRFCGDLSIDRYRSKQICTTRQSVLVV